MNSYTLICLVCIAVAASAKVLPPKHSTVMALNPNGRLVLTDEESGVPTNCDFSCTDQDVPVCAHNGQCMQKFTSHCTMGAYNCRHPQKKFGIIENWRCEESWAPLCDAADHKELNL